MEPLNGFQMRSCLNMTCSITWCVPAGTREDNWKTFKLNIFLFFWGFSELLTSTQHSICSHFACKIDDVTKHRIHMPNEENDRNARYLVVQRDAGWQSIFSTREQAINHWFLTSVGILNSPCARYWAWTAPNLQLPSRWHWSPISLGIEQWHRFPQGFSCLVSIYMFQVDFGRQNIIVEVTYSIYVSPFDSHTST